MVRNIKKFIGLLGITCALLCMIPLAFATETVGMERKLVIGIPTENHVANTPQYSDTLTADVTLLQNDVLDPNQIIWYRHYSAKYDDEGKLIQEEQYIETGRGLTYTVTQDDYRHTLKCECAQFQLSASTDVVAKKNYGKPELKVTNNSYYGDTDGCIYFLDQRMEYTHDEINIHSVDTDRGVLYSGENLDSLNPKGYTWLVRFKGTELQEQSAWESFTIAAGKKLALEKLTISTEELSLTPSNSSALLVATCQPEHAYVACGQWQSSDESVASVDENGNVQSHSNGTAVISYTVNHDCTDAKELSVSCNVTVSNYEFIDHVSIAEDSIHMSITDEHLRRELSHEIYPDTVKNYTEAWESDQPEVCHVENGVITAVSAGTATITYTVTQNDQVFTDSVTVTIDPPASVSSESSWARLSNKDLVFTFEGFPIDDSIIVSVEKANGQTEVIYPGNYTIEGNTLTIDHEYLYYLPEGDNRIVFSMPGTPEVEIIPASYHSSEIKPVISSLASCGKTPQITKISESKDTEEPTNTGSSVSTVVSVKDENYTIWTDHTKHDEHGYTYHDLTPADYTINIYTDIQITDSTKTPPSPILSISANQDYLSGSNIKGPFYPTEEEKQAGVKYTCYYTATVDGNHKDLDNGDKVVFTIKYESGSETKSLQTSEVVLSGFLMSASITESDLKIDYTSNHQKNLKQYIKTVPDLDLLPCCTLEWSLLNPRHANYCTIDSDGVVHAIKDSEYILNDGGVNYTVQDPVAVHLKLYQTSGCYESTSGVRSFEFDFNVDIHLFKLLSGDHQYWQSLRKQGANFLIGGVDDYFGTVDRKHPQVTITYHGSSGDKNIPINYNPTSKYGYRLTVNTADGTVNVELPYIFMWLQHTGTYSITFTMYDKTGTIIESIINADFTIVSNKVPLTGDNFDYKPYVFSMLLSISCIICMIRTTFRKRRRQSKS